MPRYGCGSLLEPGPHAQQHRNLGRIIPRSPQPAPRARCSSPAALLKKGDSWVDPAGMCTAFAAAQPVWELFGAAVPRGVVMPVAESREQLAFPLAWYQHGEGHVAWPAYDEFYDDAEMFGE